MGLDKCQDDSFAQVKIDTNIDAGAKQCYAHFVPRIIMAELTPTERVVALIPCYNARKYIREAVMSLINQTRKPNLIVVLDDRSGDGFEQEIVDLVEERDDVVIHVNPKNLGISACRNEGFKQFPADYYILLDADDTAFPTRVEKSLAYLSQHPNCAAVGSYIKIINEKSKPIKDGTHFYCLTPEYSQLCRAGDDMLGLLPSTVCLRSEVVHRDGYLFKEGLDACEDTELWNRIIEHPWDIICLPEPLIGYRVHASSVCSTQTKKVSRYGGYVQELKRRRRKGEAAISFEEFEQILRQRPWKVRWLAEYKRTCYALYRNGGACIMNNRYTKGVFMMGLAILIQPQRLMMVFYHLKQYFNRFKTNP